ncbi:MAG: hypothetical protein ACRC35_00050 [Angustibacter sp.]
MSTSGPEQPQPGVVRRLRRPSVAEQAQARRTQPIGDGSAYSDAELFAEPGELDDFLVYLRESRRAAVS